MPPQVQTLEIDRVGRVDIVLLFLISRGVVVGAPVDALDVAEEEDAEVFVEEPVAHLSDGFVVTVVLLIF